MFDHAPHIRAQQQAAQDESAMAELERRSAPLHWALIVAVLVLSMNGLSEQAAAFVAHYAELYAANEALVACLNGQLANVGGVFISCNEHASTLIAQVQP